MVNSNELIFLYNPFPNSSVFTHKKFKTISLMVDIYIFFDNNGGYMNYICLTLTTGIRDKWSQMLHYKRDRHATVVECYIIKIFI